jgi:putative transposase
MSSNEKSEAWPEEKAGRHDAIGMGDLDPPRLCGDPVQPDDLYKSRRSGQAALEQRIKEICQTRMRFGYRRVHVLLRREGW